MPALGAAAILIASVMDGRADVLYTVDDPVNGFVAQYLSPTYISGFDNTSNVFGAPTYCSNGCDQMQIVETRPIEGFQFQNSVTHAFGNYLLVNNAGQMVTPGVYTFCCGTSSLATLTVSGSTGTDFAKIVSNSWLLISDGSSNLIDQQFIPRMDGHAIGLDAAAALGGFDHFNVEQVITSIKAVGIPMTRDVGPDPAIGGNPGQISDNYPWYFNEIPSPWGETYNSPDVVSDISMNWQDAPNLGFGRFGTVVNFTDYLVGVYADHTGVRISDLYPDAQNVNFEWSFQQNFTPSLSGSDWIDDFTSYVVPEPDSANSSSMLGYFGINPIELSSVSATLETTVPEPLSLSLFGAGLAGILFARRRKTAAPRS